MLEMGSLTVGLAWAQNGQTFVGANPTTIFVLAKVGWLSVCAVAEIHVMIR